MELTGGVVAAKRAGLSSSVADGGEDRLSALPDDILVLILHRIGTLAAGQTSILSRRWRRVWTLHPELYFDFAPRPDRIRDALDAHGGALRVLRVVTENASPESVAAWLPVAAPRLSGRLTFYNLVRRVGAESQDDEGSAQRGTIELPCFEGATRVELDLGFLGLAVSPAGIFARLTELYLINVQFHFPCELGDAISSPRCPCLQTLSILDCRGPNKLEVNSESLLRVQIDGLEDTPKLTIVARALQYLRVARCFWYCHDQPVACISAPRLERLEWSDLYDPSWVHLGELEHVQFLETYFFAVYGLHSSMHNHSCLLLLQHFKAVESLVLTMAYLKVLSNCEYLMDDMTMLPGITFLYLNVFANGHAFGASLFDVLRMCSGIRELILRLRPPSMEEQTACPSDCICGQQADWKTEELKLNCLQEIGITELGVSEHEVTIMKQLFNWAIVLKKLRVTFNDSVTESKAKEFRQMLQSFSRPEICKEFYIRKGFDKVLFVPEE